MSWKMCKNCARQSMIAIAYVFYMHDLLYMLCSALRCRKFCSGLSLALSSIYDVIVGVFFEVDDVSHKPHVFGWRNEDGAAKCEIDMQTFLLQENIHSPLCTPNRTNIFQDAFKHTRPHQPPRCLYVRLHHFDMVPR